MVNITETYGINMTDEEMEELRFLLILTKMKENAEKLEIPATDLEEHDEKH